MQNHDYLTYEEFGRRFFEVAVTPERVAAAFADIAGSEFAMEPIAQGPGGIAKVSANVKIQEPQVTRRLGDAFTFVIHIPLSIDLLLDLRLDKQRFVVSGDIALRATARAARNWNRSWINSAPMHCAPGPTASALPPSSAARAGCSRPI